MQAITFDRTEHRGRHAVMLRTPGESPRLIGYAILDSVLGTWQALDARDRDITKSPEHPEGVRFASRNAVAGQLVGLLS